MTLSRSEARRLAMKAAEVGSRIVRGKLVIGPDGPEVDGLKITEWLAPDAGTEVILIAAPVGEVPLEDEVKTCLTCGRDYSGDFCPYCAEARARLRG